MGQIMVKRDTTYRTRIIIKQSRERTVFRIFILICGMNVRGVPKIIGSLHAMYSRVNERDNKQRREIVLVYYSFLFTLFSLHSIFFIHYNS